MTLQTVPKPVTITQAKNWKAENRYVPLAQASRPIFFFFFHVYKLLAYLLIANGRLSTRHRYECLFWCWVSNPDPHNPGELAIFLHPIFLLLGFFKIGTKWYVLSVVKSFELRYFPLKTYGRQSCGVVMRNEWAQCRADTGLRQVWGLVSTLQIQNKLEMQVFWIFESL